MNCVMGRRFDCRRLHAEQNNPPLSSALPLRADSWATLMHQQPLGYHFTGTKTGAPLSFTKNTINFADFVLLAFRPMT